MKLVCFGCVRFVVIYLTTFVLGTIMCSGPYTLSVVLKEVKHT